MDLSWGDEKTRKFITNVGLVTSTGPYGDNIMAAEWTHHISYSPGMIAICIDTDEATYSNIKETKEFGVSLCSTSQAVLSSVSGGNTGKEVDKIKALEELGFKFYKGKKIKALMVTDAALNVECKLVEELKLGDHIMMVGEVIEASKTDKEPLAYHQGKYWRISETLPKPPDEERERIKGIVEKHKK